MRIAIGPFASAEAAWPVRGHAALLPDYEIVPFGPGQSPPDGVDATIWWSLEYHGGHPDALPGFRVAVIGDWHITDPVLATGWEMVAADLRYTRTHPAVGAFAWRQFSYDPDLHRLPPPGTARPLDVAHMGRPNAARCALLEQVEAWAQRDGYQTHLVTVPYERGAEVPVYQAAKIVLGDSQRGELQMRAYEAIACGALYVCQHDTEEVWHSGAPIPTYQREHVGPFLAAWLADEPGRQATVAKQQAWLQHEAPADHLRVLCDEIARRLSNAEGRSAGRASIFSGLGPGTADPTGGARAHRTDQLVAAAPSGGQWIPPENEQRPEVVALVPPLARRILDLGCHQGGVGWRLRQDRPGAALHLTGVDVDPRAVARATDLYGYDDAYAANLDGVWSEQAWSADTYDCIIAADVLEHLRDPWAAVGTLRDLLNPDGVIVASIPNIRNVANLFALVRDGEWHYHVHTKDAWRGPHDNVLSWEHLRFFTRQSVQALFEDAGFAIVQWGASRLGWEQGQSWHDAVAHLVAAFGGDAEAFKDEAWTIQHLVVAKVKGERNQ